MQVTQTEIADVFVVEPRVFRDERGVFLESWQQERYAAAGMPGRFVQDNFSRSAQGVVRGLHYQIARPQAKLVQVTRGEVFDVVVDLRRSSPTFGRWVGVVLSDSNFRQLYVPEGCAHGFSTTSDVAAFYYKCSDYYSPEHERTLLWNDPALGIAWPLDVPPIVSEKDRRGLPLAEAECFP